MSNIERYTTNRRTLELKKTEKNKMEDNIKMKKKIENGEYSGIQCLECKQLNKWTHIETENKVYFLVCECGSVRECLE